MRVRRAPPLRWARRRRWKRRRRQQQRRRGQLHAAATRGARSRPTPAARPRAAGRCHAGRLGGQRRRPLTGADVPEGGRRGGGGNQCVFSTSHSNIFILHRYARLRRTRDLFFPTRAPSVMLFFPTRAPSVMLFFPTRAPSVQCFFYAQNSVTDSVNFGEILPPYKLLGK